jgi:hypothetical protein
MNSIEEVCHISNLPKSLFDKIQGICIQLFTKKIYQANLHHKGPKGRSNAGWKDDVENDVREMSFANWRQVTRDRDEWRRTFRETLILLG